MQEGRSFFNKFTSDVISIAGADSRALLLAFSMCVGAATYVTAPFEIPLMATLLGFLAVSLGAIAVRNIQQSDIVYGSAIIMFGIMLGFTAGSVRARLVDAPVIEAETRPVMLEGWVSNVEPGQKGARLQIRVHSIQGYSQSELPVKVRVTHRSRLEVSSGRFVRCWVVLRPPPSPTLPGDYDFRRQAYFQQLGAVGYVQGRCRGGALGSPVAMKDKAALWIAAQRRVFAVYINEAAGERAGGLAAALIAGDRSFLRADDQAALRDTGLAHLLAISGMHLSIVGGMTYLIIRRTLGLIEPLALRIPVQKIAALLGLLACAVYLVISGATVSTQRAFIMAAIVFLALMFDRSAISLRTFAIAMIAVLLMQPESVVTPGFQMSFAATGALIAAYEVWRNHRGKQAKTLGPIGFAWASIVMTSVVSDAATAPYSFYHFDRLAPVGLFANFAVMPVVTFVSGPAAAAAIVLTLFGQPDIGLRIFGQSLELVLAMTHYFYNLSPDTIEFTSPMPAASLAFLSLALASAIIFKGWPRLVFGILLFMPAVFLWTGAPKILAHWSVSGDLYISNSQGFAERMELGKGDGLPPLRFIEAKDIKPCADNECQYTSIEGVIITLSRIPSASADDELQNMYEVTVRPPDDEFAHEPLRWEEVKASGGSTIYLHKGAVRQIPIEKCSKRPWRRCPDSS